MQSEIFNNRYQIKSQLSKRRGRETLLAQDLDTQKLVVIKLLKFGLDSEWDDFKLFEREAKVLQNLDRPDIPKYLDYFELDLPHSEGFPQGYRYAYALVQNYIDAPSLSSCLTAGRSFSESDIKQIAEAMLNILIYLHQRQPAIIHRDIKPSNILLSNRSGNSVGQVYLIDFGAVQNVAAAEGGTITVVGTYGYMPPEQFGGKTIPASDLYSLGATLIYLATGKHPTDLPEQDGRILFEGLVSLNPALMHWLRKMSEPIRDRRFKSANEALQALKNPVKQHIDLVKQPKFRRMIMEKTPETIEVLIPASGFTPPLSVSIFVALIWNGFIAIWTIMSLIIPFPINILFCLFSIPFWIIGWSFISSILFTLWGKTRLKITSQQISLTYECLGIKYQKPKPAARQDITAIELTGTQWRIDGDGDKIQISSSVVIWAKERAYSLDTSIGSKTTGAKKISKHAPETIELNWLVQELSQWLNLPLTQKPIKPN